MNIESFFASPALVTLITALLGHTIIIVYFAGKLVAKVDVMNASLSRIDRELEKRDEQITALWKRVDQLRDMIGR